MLKVLWQRRRVDLIGATVAVLLGAFLITLETRALRPRRHAAACLSNLKQIGLAMSQYSRNYDERFPLSTNWTQAIKPYYNRPQLPFLCPARADLPVGYALNGRIAATALGAIDAPQRVRMVFDSDKGGFNPVDKPASLPLSMRHPHGNGVVFVDGHVKFLPSSFGSKR